MSGSSAVDLSVSGQFKALKVYTVANGYSVARDHADEAESNASTNAS